MCEPGGLTGSVCDLFHYTTPSHKRDTSSGPPWVCLPSRNQEVAPFSGVFHYKWLHLGSQRVLGYLHWVLGTLSRPHLPLVRYHSVLMWPARGLAVWGPPECQGQLIDYHHQQVVFCIVSADWNGPLVDGAYVFALVKASPAGFDMLHLKGLWQSQKGLSMVDGIWVTVLWHCRWV